MRRADPDFLIRFVSAFYSSAKNYKFAEVKGYFVNFSSLSVVSERCVGAGGPGERGDGTGASPTDPRGKKMRRHPHVELLLPHQEQHPEQDRHGR